jgi:hypothetical protein
MTLGSTLAEALTTFAACETRQYVVEEEVARRATIDAPGGEVWRSYLRPVMLKSVGDWEEDVLWRWPDVVLRLRSR